MTIRLGAADPAGGDVYDLEITACGQAFFVRRSHAVMRRLEQVAGPLMPLVEKLQAAAVTQAELARIYRALLDDDRLPPAPKALDEWLFATGTATAARAIALDVLSLVAGNAVLRALTAEERKQRPPEDDEEEADQNRRPFSRAASSTGN